MDCAVVCCDGLAELLSTSTAGSEWHPPVGSIDITSFRLCDSPEDTYPLLGSSSEWRITKSSSSTMDHLGGQEPQG